MFDPQTELLITVLTGVLPGPETWSSPSKTWADAKAALAACGEKEADLVAAVEDKNFKRAFGAS